MREMRARLELLVIEAEPVAMLEFEGCEEAMQTLLERAL